MLKKLVFTFFSLTLLLFGDKINIAVAANVSYAIPQLIKEFNKIYPDIVVEPILGSSGKLTAQISHGASYGIFMSANMKYPQRLYERKIAISKPVVYAQGALAFLSVKKHDFSKGMELLKDKDIRVIATANPKTAPYGIAAKEAMKNAGVYNEIKHKFVYGESISQTVSYTVMAADIGLVAKSSLFSPKMSRFKKGINWIDVDKNLYTPINQGMVLLKQNKDTKLFYDFILSEKAKEIFKEFGYSVL